MKTYKNLYPKLYSYKNLLKAFKKARKGKSSKLYVIKFEKNLKHNILKLKQDLENLTYKPFPLIKFTIRDPKVRTIRKSNFRDRIVHHAIVNILEPIYEKEFIYDSYANRVNKGTLAALKRFDYFKRKVSQNGKQIKQINNNFVKGYILKADIKQFFDSLNHKILINILKIKIRDNKLINLIKIIIKNFDDKEKGIPLGNMTSQFFANVYLNNLDYFIKHILKSKYYIRYVDDFIILHENKNTLEIYKEKINNYLKILKLKLHKDKSKVFSIHKGVNLLGFRIFYHYKLLRKRNIILFNKKLKLLNEKCLKGELDYNRFSDIINGWFAYAKWANTYKLRIKLVNEINLIL